MDKLKPVGDEQIVYSGTTFEIIKKSFKAGTKSIVLEIARRSPGVRLIIVNNNKILLTKEFRFELDDYDYRLPGGKVFDSLKDYRSMLDKKEDILQYATESAKKECLEETGLIVNNIKHFQTTQAGATATWDLFYFIVDDFKESGEGQNLEIGEVIHPEWKTFEEVKEMCLNNDIKEDRTVGVLLKFFMRKTN